ncbi:MAG: restriction endonuclease subunit S [Candidatus Thiodiazotropha sp.]
MSEVVEIDEIDLPEGWQMAELAELAINPKDDIVDGPFGSNLKASEYTETGVPIVRLQNIKRNYFLDKNIKCVTPEKAEQLSRHNFKPGDLLITKLGAPLGVACIAPKNIGEGIIVADLVRARLPEDEVDTKYITYLINSPEVIQQFKENTKGTTRPRVNLKFVRSLQLPIAPYEQQKRIVAKIEELFSHIDVGIEALKNSKQLIKQYRQSVLKAAVTGELTKEWREANKNKLEPASQILKKIEKQKLAAYEKEIETWNNLINEWENSGKNGKKPSKLTKPKKVEPLSTEELKRLPTLPDGWVWAKILQVSTKITDGEHFKPPTEESGVYFLSAKDIREEGVNLENPLYISEETAKKALLRCNPEYGDILIVSRGATVGRMCVVDTHDVFCLLGSVILIKVADGIDSSYLLNVMKSPDINKNIANVSGATAQQAIYLRDIQHVAVPICSFSEQQEIQRIVAEKLDSIDRLQKVIESQIVLGERNKQAILSKAFSGTLVMPLEGDEPASLLLQKIREKERAPKKKSKSAEKKSVKKMEESMRRAIIDVLKEEGDAVEITSLMQKAGFDVTEVESFYYELGDVADQIMEIRPSKSEAKDWPYNEIVSIKLRK